MCVDYCIIILKCLYVINLDFCTFIHYLIAKLKCVNIGMLLLYHFKVERQRHLFRNCSLCVLCLVGNTMCVEIVI